MKVLWLNGSPHEKGCTHTALCEVANTLEREGVSAEIFWPGTGRFRTAWIAAHAGRCMPAPLSRMA